MKAAVFLSALWLLTLPACIESGPDADKLQHDQQAQILAEGAAAVGMPAIKNFREKRLLKDIIELRDQTGLSTFTYLVSLQGTLVFFCHSVGYALPYSVQFTNPQQLKSPGTDHEYTAIAQADPNGLFSPSSADGTWVMCKDPHGTDVRPVFVEPRIVVSPFKFGELTAPTTKE